MRIVSRALLIVSCALCAVAVSFTSAPAQEKEVKNPLADNPEAIEQGRALFRLTCSLCHGIDARGGRGPDLTSGRWTHGESDAAIFRTVTKGVPGTAMPAFDWLREEEVWMLVAFLRSLGAGATEPIAGDPQAGEKTFFGAGGCSRCHMAHGKGGRLGPDLSRIGVSRSARFIRESIREPNTDLAEGLLEPGKDFAQLYDTVIAVTKDGRRITGVARNEDTFTLQLMDQQEQLHLLLKKDLREVTHRPESLMPAYTEQLLGEKDLQDLLAYLVSLRGQ